jgi:hypothetical protein
MAEVTAAIYSREIVGLVADGGFVPRGDGMPAIAPGRHPDRFGTVAVTCSRQVPQLITRQALAPYVLALALAPRTPYESDSEQIF